MRRRSKEPEPSPLLRVEALFDELVEHYGDGSDREIRAAAKILLVALDKFRLHGGPGWQGLLDDYVDMVKHRPDKFERVLKTQRAEGGDPFLA